MVAKPGSALSSLSCVSICCYRLNTAISCTCLALQMSEGRVVAVGPGRRGLTGDIIPVSVKAGDTVLLPEFGGTNVKLDGGNECALPQPEVLADFAHPPSASTGFEPAPACFVCARQGCCVSRALATCPGLGRPGPYCLPVTPNFSHVACHDNHFVCF